MDSILTLTVIAATVFPLQLDLFAFGSESIENNFNSQLIDDSYALGANFERNKSVFFLNPETMILNIG